MITLEDDGSSPATCSRGAAYQRLSGISASGDQIFAYQGSGAGTTTTNSDFGLNASTNTFTGTILFGLNFGSPWLAAGTASSLTSYLPLELNVADGNVVLAASGITSGQYTGDRTAQTSFAAYRALVNDPANWTSVTGSGSISLNATAFNTGSTNLPPTVTITNPVNGAIFAASAAIRLCASATDDGFVTNVAFYADGTLIGNNPCLPYSGTWTGVAVGHHALMAVAWDDTGLCTTSTVVNICVNGALTAGNLVVYRVGDGGSNLVNTGSPVYLDEYTTNGVLVQSLAMPTNAAAGNYPLIASGTATSEGMLTRSTNGHSLVLAGYGTTLGGGTSLAGTSATNVPRVVGVVGYNGTVDTTTALRDFADQNNPRSAVTTDGSNIWVAGATDGLRYATRGGTNSTQLLSSSFNIRQVNAFGGRLYGSSGSGSNRLGTVGAGLPATAGQTIANLPGVPTNGSPYAFFMADLTHDGTDDTLYVADDLTGLQKYSLVSGTWVANGIVGTSSNSFRGIAGCVTGTNVNLFLTGKGGSIATGGGELIRITDNSGYNGALSGTPTLLATAPANTAFRGVALAPIPPPPAEGTVYRFR